MTTTVAKGPAQRRGMDTAVCKPLLFRPSIRVHKTDQTVGAKHKLKHQYLAKHMEKCKQQKLDSRGHCPGKKHAVNLKQSNTNTIRNLVVQDTRTDSWKSKLPAAAKLLTTKFGRPNSDHSATQEACGETTLLPLMKSQYLDKQSKQALYASYPLVVHMAQVSKALLSYDFICLKSTNTAWASQTAIPEMRQKTIMACLFHYNLNILMVMRFMGRFT